VGEYTEFHFNARLIDKVPSDVTAMLEYMVGDSSYCPKIHHQHVLFNTARWQHMLRMDSSYFEATTDSSVTCDEFNSTYYLNIRCNFKNYCEEIRKFIDWISPYLNHKEGDFLGFYRWSGTETPTLIHHKLHITSE